MKVKHLIALALLVSFGALAAACTKPGSSGEQVVKSAKSGDMTVTLASAPGGFKSGDNELMVSFTDAAGKPVDVGAASLNFHMAAMAVMAEMNDKAKITTTDTPGKYRVQVNLEVAGTWEAQIKYQGAHGTGQATINVQAK